MSRVQAIERAFAVLSALSDGPIGVTEVADRVHLPKSTAARLLSAGGPLPLAALEKEFVKMPKAAADLGYLQSWLAADYLEESYGPYAHRDLLRYLGQGDDIRAAVKRLTGRDFETFDREFQKWVADWAEIAP